MDKFQITAELQLQLASGVDSKVEELKKKIESKSLLLKVKLDKRSLNPAIKRLEKLRDTKIETKVGFDIDYLRKETKLVYRELKLLRNSLSNNVIRAKVGIDINGLQTGIKSAYSELKKLRDSLKNSLNVSIVFGDTSKLDDILTKLNRIRNSTISFQIRKTSIKNVESLSVALKKLARVVKKFPRTNIRGMANDLATIRGALTGLGRLSNKSFNFKFNTKKRKQQQEML